MNNEDAQAIKHAVAAGIHERLSRELRSDPVAQRYFEAGWKAYEAHKGSPTDPVCPHCGTPWTWYQLRGYDKHPCDEWRNDPVPGTERAGEAHSASTGHLSNITESLEAGATVTMHGPGGAGGSTGACVHDCENGMPSPLCKVHGHYWD